MQEGRGSVQNGQRSAYVNNCVDRATIKEPVPSLIKMRSVAGRGSHIRGVYGDGAHASPPLSI